MIKDCHEFSRFEVEGTKIVYEDSGGVVLPAVNQAELPSSYATIRIMQQDIELSRSDAQWVLKALARGRKRLDENNNEVLLPPSDINLMEDIQTELRAATGDTVTVEWRNKSRILVANALRDESTALDARTRKPIYGEATRDALTKLTMKFL